jgi:hypothetical protein
MAALAATRTLPNPWYGLPPGRVWAAMFPTSKGPGEIAILANA